MNNLASFRVELETETDVHLDRDIKKISASLTKNQARFLVDYYYQIQDMRIAAAAQERSLASSEEPNAVITWFAERSYRTEKNILSALDTYSSASRLGRWAKSITGIGPVLASGLLCHIDITRAPSVGHIWAFAGLDPGRKWAKGQKRPWNADLKRLCWLIGESFVKQSGRASDFYGKLWLQRKELETARNDAGQFTEQAQRAMQEKKFGLETVARKYYLENKLPPAHIHARAKRFAVKMFLAHYHEVAYFLEYNTRAPLPYVMDHLGHVHKIEVPNRDIAGLPY